MHLDERLEKSREILGKQLAVGQQKFSSAYNRLWAEMEAMREAQRQKAEEAKIQAEKEGRPVDDAKKCKSGAGSNQCQLINCRESTPGSGSVQRSSKSGCLFV